MAAVVAVEAEVVIAATVVTVVTVVIVAAAAILDPRVVPLTPARRRRVFPAVPLLVLPSEQQPSLSLLSQQSFSSAFVRERTTRPLPPPTPTSTTWRTTPAMPRRWSSSTIWASNRQWSSSTIWASNRQWSSSSSWVVSSLLCSSTTSLICNSHTISAAQYWAQPHLPSPLHTSMQAPWPPSTPVNSTKTP